MMEERLDPRFFIKERGTHGVLSDLDQAWTEEELERKIRKHVESGIDPAKIHIHADLSATISPEGDVRIHPTAFGKWVKRSLLRGTEYAVAVPAAHPYGDDKVFLEVKGQLITGQLQGRTPESIGEILAMYHDEQSMFGHQPVIMKIIQPKMTIDVSGPDPVLE